MKVLFLDIDGVLNSTASCLAKTDAKCGFTAADYFKAAALLGITESEIIF